MFRKSELQDHKLGVDVKNEI